MLMWGSMMHRVWHDDTTRAVISLAGCYFGVKLALSVASRAFATDDQVRRWAWLFHQDELTRLAVFSTLYDEETGALAPEVQTKLVDGRRLVMFVRDYDGDQDEVPFFVESRGAFLAAGVKWRRGGCGDNGEYLSTGWSVRCESETKSSKLSGELLKQLKMPTGDACPLVSSGRHWKLAIVEADFSMVETLAQRHGWNARVEKETGTPWVLTPPGVKPPLGFPLAAPPQHRVSGLKLIDLKSAAERRLRDVASGCAALAL